MHSIYIARSTGHSTPTYQLIKFSTVKINPVQVIDDHLVLLVLFAIFNCELCNAEISFLMS